MGRMRHFSQQQLQCIGDDVALASLEALATVEAQLPAHGGGLDQVAMDDSRCWTGITPGLDAHTAVQRVVDSCDHAAREPAAQVRVDDLPGGKPWVTKCHRYPVLLS